MKFFRNKLWMVLGIVMLLTACGKEYLHQDLSELDANEILVVLYQNGIKASKVRVQQAQDVSYSIQVPKDKIHQARRILVENNLPRKKELGFAGICQEKGLIPTPEEEKCRKLLALKGEIVNSLERIPGVVDADVVLNIPEVSEFATEDTQGNKPTASSVIRVKKDSAGDELSEGRIQRYISNTVENLDPRDVSVIISYVEPPEKAMAKGPVAPKATQAKAGPAPKFATIAGLTLAQNSLQRFKIYAVAMLLILIGVSAALIINVVRMTRMRQELKVSRVQSGVKGLPGAGAAPRLPEGSDQSGKPLAAPEGEKSPVPPAGT